MGPHSPWNEPLKVLAITQNHGYTTATCKTITRHPLTTLLRSTTPLDHTSWPHLLTTPLDHTSWQHSLTTQGSDNYINVEDYGASMSEVAMRRWWIAAVHLVALLSQISAALLSNFHCRHSSSVVSLLDILVRNHINMHKLVYGTCCYPHRTARKSIFVGCAGLSLSGSHISESEYNS